MERIMKIIDYRATTAILLFLLALLFSLPNLVIAMVLMLLISGILEAIRMLADWGAREKNLIAFDLFTQAAGLGGMEIDTVGSRHSSLLAIMSAGASRVMEEEELMKVVRVKMPSYYQENDCHQLIHDFYAKYADNTKPMSREVMRVNALAEQKANEVKSEERRVNNSNAVTNYAVQSSNLKVQSTGEDYPDPPEMPKKLPKLVELLISRTPEIYKFRLWRTLSSRRWLRISGRRGSGILTTWSTRRD